MNQQPGRGFLPTKLSFLPTYLQQSWHRWRGEAISALAVVGVLVVVDAGLAVLWAWWAPQLAIIASPRGALVADEQPEAYISADARFGLIVGVTGVLVGVAAWFVRRFRGPVLLVTLALGTFAGSWVMWQIGEAIGTSRGQDIVSAMATGEHGQAPIVQLHATGLLFLQPLLAVLMYVGCVSWASSPDLRSAPVVPVLAGGDGESAVAADITPAQVGQ